MTWHRWRWQHGFTFQPWTKYHLFTAHHRTLCGRHATQSDVASGFGQDHDDPPVERRCAICERKRQRGETRR